MFLQFDYHYSLMLDPYTERQRKPLPNHKNKDALLLHISPNILAAYTREPKCKSSKPLTHRPKGKENKDNKKSKRSVKQQEFPEHVIKFRNDTFESNKINDSFSSKHHAAQHLQESFGRNNFDCKEEPKCNSKPEFDDKKGQALLSKQAQDSNSQNKKYSVKYSQALEKIFKSLDVFNRGKISQTNINKWIPESALYFLGGVFQKIRQQRLTLVLSEFETLCRPLLLQSGEDDVRWFIQQVNGKQTHLNVSIETGSEQKFRESSPVQMRVNYQEERQKIKEEARAFVKKSSASKEEPFLRQPIEFSEILNNIKTKEKQLNIRLSSMKEKHNQTQHPIPKNKVNQFSFFSSNPQCPSASNIDPPQFKQIKISAVQKKPAIFEQSEYFEKLIVKDAKVVPSFAFRLPKENQIPSRANPRLQYNTRETPEKSGTIPDHQDIPPSRTSRIVRQSVPKSLASSCSKRSSNNSQQTDRLDKLSSRLEEYIQFNKQKIEQNKRFLKQNSTPRK